MLVNKNCNKLLFPHSQSTTMIAYRTLNTECRLAQGASGYVAVLLLFAFAFFISHAFRAAALIQPILSLSLSSLPASFRKAFFLHLSLSLLLLSSSQDQRIGVVQSTCKFPPGWPSSPASKSTFNKRGSEISLPPFQSESILLLPLAFLGACDVMRIWYIVCTLFLSSSLLLSPHEAGDHS